MLLMRWLTANRDAVAALAFGRELQRVPWQFAALRALNVNLSMLQRRNIGAAAGGLARDHVAECLIVLRLIDFLTLVAVRTPVSLQREMSPFTNDRLRTIEGERGIDGKLDAPPLLAPMWLVPCTLGEGAPCLAVLPTAPMPLLNAAPRKQNCPMLTMPR